MLRKNYLTLQSVLGGSRIIMAVVGDKCPQRISEAKPDNFTESQLHWHNGNSLSIVCETFVFFRYILDTSLFPAAIITSCPVFSCLLIGSFVRFLWAVVEEMYLFLSGFIWYFLRNLLLTYGQIMRNGGQRLSPHSGRLAEQSFQLTALFWHSLWGWWLWKTAVEKVIH